MDGTLLDRVRALVLAIDRYGAIAMFNRACEEFTGCGRAAATGNPLWHFCPDPAEAERVAAQFPLLPGVKRPEAIAMTWRDREGHDRAIVWHAEWQAEADSDLILCTGTIADPLPPFRIDGSNPSQQLAFLQAVLDAIPNLVFVKNGRGQYIYVNQAVAQLYERPIEECLGYADREFYRDLAADDRLGDDDRQVLFSLRAKQVAVEPIAHANGDIRWFQTIERPLVVPDCDEHFTLSLAMDITERKQTEEELLRITKAVECSSDAIAIADREGLATYLNPAFVALFDYDLDTLNAIGGFAAIFCERENYGYIVTTIQTENSWSGALTLRDRAGKTIDAALRLDAIRNGAGAVVGFVSICTDITASRRIEEELRRANEKLEQSVRDLEHHNREIVRLGEMSEVLQACLSVDEACNAIATLIQPLFPDCSGGVFTIGAPKNLVEMAATWGGPLTSEVLFAPNDCWALRRGRLHYSSIQRDRLACHHILPHYRPLEALCVPMVAQGETLGLLYLSTERPQCLDESRQQLAQTVSEHIALALANLRLRETLQYQSVRDPLTGLYNRRYLEESLERELHRARRKQLPLGFIMLDIDRFKYFNDTFGHEAGDVVLRELALFLQQSVRISDVVCRYGGEEFAILLPEAAVEDARQRAEHLRQEVKHLQVRYDQELLGSISISLGVACFPLHAHSALSLVRTADDALYAAKAQGRDRVVVAEHRDAR